MNKPIDELLARMRVLELALEEEMSRKRREVEFVLERSRARFPLEVLSRQLLHKVSLGRYVLGARWSVALTAPLVYALLLPMLLTDLIVTLYQRVCFPVWGIPSTRRRDYMVFDRVDLPYLNALEKLNCAYCSYGNGVAAYVREVAARTEQYWCPIKHARRVLAAHGRYPGFFEFGDAQAYREGIERMRRAYGDED